MTIDAELHGDRQGAHQEHHHREHTRVKDMLASALVLGVASAAWFAWGLQGQRVEIFLTAGIVLGVVAAVTAFVVRRKAPGKGSHQLNPQANRVWNFWALFEVVFFFLGAMVLGRLGHPEYIPAWILFIVGVHFYPLARFYRLGSLVFAATATVAVAGLAVLAGIQGWAPPVTVTGLLGGGVLLFVSALSQVTGWRTLRTAPATG